MKQGRSVIHKVIALLLELIERRRQKGINDRLSQRLRFKENQIFAFEQARLRVGLGRSVLEISRNFFLCLTLLRTEAQRLELVELQITQEEC